MTVATYSKHTRTRNTNTPQTEPIFGSNQIPNAAGGFVYQIDLWKRLDRFLVLGTEGGTYYASEQKLTRDNATSLIEAIKLDGVRVVDRVLEISDAGRAPKNDPALFVLALVTAHGNAAAKARAYEVLPKVARIGTHILHFAEYANSLRGWGRGLRSALGNWYNVQTPKALAVNLAKYANRDGWTHRDILRLSHAKPVSPEHGELFRYAVGKDTDFSKAGEAGEFLEAVARIASEKDSTKAAKLITQYNLPREVVPTELLNTSEIWEALLPHMGITALIRNLATMTRIGLIAPNSTQTRFIIDKLTDKETLRKGRVHPIQLLSAMRTYGSGQGFRGSNTWTPNQRVVDALDDAFYVSFDFIRPTGKRFMLGLDVSSSMTWGNVAGVPGITPRVGTAAMAMLVARTEKEYHSMAFTSTFSKFDISPRERLDSVMERMDRMNFGGTDCALPMKYAMKNKIPVDAFIVYTDNETWAGDRHPSEALKQYRKAEVADARLAVVGMTATESSIADPNDAGMLDVVGFDTATPNIISDFVRGEL